MIKKIFIILLFFASCGAGMLAIDRFLSEETEPFRKKAEPLRSRFEDKVLSTVQKLTGEETEEVSLPEDFLPAQRRYLKNVFFMKNGNHFSQSKWGAVPVTYQIKGLKLTGPNKIPAKPSDSANGIGRRISFSFEAEGYRRFGEKEGWGDWAYALPPNLRTLTMIQKGGLWEVVSGPAEFYSIQ